VSATGAGVRGRLLSRLKSGSALVDATTKALYLYAPPVPTVVQYYINTSSTSGGDGTTNATTGAGRAFVDWASAKTAIYAAYPNFVAANVQVNVNVTGLVSQGTSFDMTGFVGDDTHFLQLRAASGQAHAGYYDVTKAGFTSTVAQIVYPVANYVRFDRLQIVSTSSGLSYGNGFQEDATEHVGIVVSNCVIHRTGRSAGTITGGDAYSYGGVTFNKLVFVNNVISGSWYNGFTKSYATDGSQIVVYNNTVIGATNVGISLSGGIPTGTGFLKNNRVEGGTACYALGSNVLTTATNFSSDTTSPDTAGRSKTGTYVNAAGFNYTLTSGDAGVGAGTPTVYDVTYLLTTDIIGTARPQQTTWDVGAFEYVPSAGYTMPADAGTFAVSGQAVGLLATRTFPADVAAFTLSGQNVNLFVTRPLLVDAGSFAVAGNDVAFLYSKSITVNTGTFAVAGQDVALTSTRFVTASATSFALTGNDVILSVTSAGAFVLIADPAAIALAGQNVALTATRFVTASSAAFAVAGQDVLLSTQHLMLAGTGSFALAGQDVSLVTSKLITASVASFAVAGQDVGLRATRTLPSDAGSFLLTGQSVTLTYVPINNFVLAAGAGTFAVAGQSVTLSLVRLVSAGIGSFALTGQDVTFSKTFAVTAGTGVFAVAGQDVVLRYLIQIVFVAREGTFTFAGKDVSFTYLREVVVGAGSFAWSGQTVTLIKSKTLVAGTGSFALTGKPVGLLLNGEYGASLVGQTSVNPFTGPFRV
jgi:hypothetical protein